LGSMLDLKIFLEDTGGGRTYLDWLMTAWGWTMLVAMLALIVALVTGTLVGILRTTPNKWLVLFGDAWTELFRNIPLLVQLFIWYYVLPSIFPKLQAVPGMVLAVFGLGFFTSARIAEQVRAGIMALPKGQRYAGLAIGLTLPQTYATCCCRWRSHRHPAGDLGVDEHHQELCRHLRGADLGADLLRAAGE